MTPEREAFLESKFTQYLDRKLIHLRFETYWYNFQSNHWKEICWPDPAWKLVADDPSIPVGFTMEECIDRLSMVIFKYEREEWLHNHGDRRDESWIHFRIPQFYKKFLDTSES